MGKIAVIDDSRADIELIGSILKSGQHEVVPFQDVAAVEDQVAATQPDLVLLDVVMPQRSGYEILRRLKRHEQTRGIPVVLVSSKGEDADVAWGKRQGADAYVVKPFTSETLLAEVGQFFS